MKDNNNKGLAPIMIIVLVAVGVTLLFGFRIISEHFLGTNKVKFEGFPKKENSNISENFSGESREENCQSGEIPKFEAEFTDFEKINAINPIGGIGGGSPGRSYIGVIKGTETPIYSPTDMILENIIYAKRPNDSLTSLTNTNPEGEYGL